MKTDVIESVSKTYDTKYTVDVMRRRARRMQREALILLFFIFVGGGAIAYLFVSYAAGFNANIMTKGDYAPAIIQLGDNFNLYSLIKDAVLRLGAVLLAIFMIRLAFAIVRYRLQTANELEERADVLGIAGDDLERMKVVVPLLRSSDRIDFGPIPDSPYDKVLDTLKEVAGKLPKAGS
jgi:hypothetical protein